MQDPLSGLGIYVVLLKKLIAPQLESIVQGTVCFLFCQCRASGRGLLISPCVITISCSVFLSSNEIHDSEQTRSPDDNMA